MMARATGTNSCRWQTWHACSTSDTTGVKLPSIVLLGTESPACKVPPRVLMPAGTASPAPAAAASGPVSSSAPTLQSEYILVVRRNSRIWLTENHPQGRWRGLHLLPTLFHRPSGPPSLEVRYPFTRYVIHAAVFLSRRPPVGGRGRWMKPAEVRRATLPAPHRKILDRLGID